MKQRFISGSDIVSTRSWRIAELFDAFFNHDLGCYRPHSVDKEYSGQSCITCAEDRPLFGVPSDSECFYGRSGCGGPYEVNYETILERLVECDFDLEDIEKYEKAHGIWQAASSAPDDVFSHLGASPDDLEPSITGEEIIARWKGSRLNLFRALRDGDLVPVDKIPLRGEECSKRLTKQLDPCLYCESPSYKEICNLHQYKHNCDHKDDFDRIYRAKIASFLMREVLEYENKVLAAEVEPDHQKVYSTSSTVETEPADAAPYVVWRRKQVASIHDGQLMREVQERWGRPPTKTMDRAEIAALVRGEDPPSPNDTNRRRCLEDAFKNAVKAYRAKLKK